MGKLNATEFGFQVEKTEEFYKQPLVGMQWRKEDYAWEETDKERTTVYDGNEGYYLKKEVDELRKQKMEQETVNQEEMRWKP